MRLTTHILALLIVAHFTTRALGQFDGTSNTTRSAVINPNLEDDLNGWTVQEPEIETISLSDSTGGFSEGELLRLTGRGAFGQFITLDRSVRHHLLRCTAFAESTNSGPVGRAGIVATYYDEDWNEVAKFESPVETRLPTTLPFTRHTYGAWIPESATTAFVFVWIYDDNTAVAIDSLDLIYVEKSTQYNANQVIGLYPPIYRTQREFWATELDPTGGTDGGNAGFVLGSGNQPESAWQFLDLNPALTYELEFLARQRGQGGLGGFKVGVEFFDASFTVIGEQKFQLPPAVQTRRNGFLSTVREDIRLPPETVYSKLIIEAPQINFFNPEVPLSILVPSVSLKAK